jgi:alkanesulfonate monooxygenase SsuD/methylene tetrahydromethanopterin reductase-like flavin-dependent oxidoreductase (luciferase family)
MATLGTGYDTRRLYNAYRQGYAEKNNGAAPAADRFGYLGLVAVGRTEAEARRRGELIASYPRSSGIVFAPFRNPPGYLSIEDNVRMLKGEGRPRSYTKDGRVVDMAKGSVQDLIDAGVMFCGTPDQVYDQLVDFVDHCGGMGNLLMMGHAGPMSHDDTVENLTLFAQEVYPRLKQLRQPEAAAVAAQ